MPSAAQQLRHRPTPSPVWPHGCAAARMRRPPPPRRGRARAGGGGGVSVVTWARLRSPRRPDWRGVGPPGGASSCQRRVRRLEDLCLRPELRLRVWCLPFVLCLRLVVRCLCLVALRLRLVVFFLAGFGGTAPVVGFAGVAAGGEAAGADAG